MNTINIIALMSVMTAAFFLLLIASLGAGHHGHDSTDLYVEVCQSRTHFMTRGKINQTNMLLDNTNKYSLLHMPLLWCSGSSFAQTLHQGRFCMC